MLAGGTGITPFMSIIRYILAKGKKNKIILFAGNVREEDIIFKEELAKINREQEHIKIVHVLNAPTQECKYDCQGYITSDIIKKYVENIKDYDFMICGPPPMIHAMQQVTSKLEIKPEKIHCEEWKINPHLNKDKTQDESLDEKNEDDRQEIATLTFQNKTEKLKPGPILNAAEKLGVPFSCRQGICGTCKVKIIEGADNLNEKNDKEKNMNLDENERLCCQAKIKKDNVKIDF
ncbi:MAG: 2Fe-2S iron-sulfur cluster-binding protein [Candidatus Woesearchaeota archaeon]